MSTVISVRNVSKSYRLGMIGGATLKEDAAQLWAKFRGRANPNAPIGLGEHTRRIGEKFWALKDVSFSVQEGEVLGVVGRNGAGKSTLLKILSQVTAPTAGEIQIKGRIASLLEVGTGFHPDLTGRENIFLNGAILGMSRSEIRRNFDAIVAFSEIEEFIDTPVKRYSSGMYVRLAFAVAAHLEPEILVIDEVLAVGDAQFQKKCVRKMGEASKAGRTVIFVSHNLAVVASLCDRAVLLEAGEKRCEGATEEVIEKYIGSVASGASEVTWSKTDPTTNNGRVRLVAARTVSSDIVTADVVIDEPTIVEYDFDVLKDGLEVCTSLHLLDKHGTCVLASGTNSRRLARGRYRHSCVFPANLLNDGHYSISIYLLTDTTRQEVVVPQALTFCVHENRARSEYFGTVIGCIRPHLEWIERPLNGASVDERRPAEMMRV